MLLHRQIAFALETQMVRDSLDMYTVEPQSTSSVHTLCVSLEVLGVGNVGVIPSFQAWLYSGVQQYIFKVAYITNTHTCNMFTRVRHTISLPLKRIQKHTRQVKS